MNYSTLVGVVIGLLTVVIAIVFSSTNALAFLNIPGLFIVVMGTLAATLSSYPMREFLRITKLIRIVLHDEKINPQKQVDEIEEIARKWFRDDIRGVEKHIKTIDNAFLKTGVQLVIDKTPLHDVLDLLRWRIARLRAQEQAEANIFRSMSGFAPAFGMLGTLIGLINMLGILDTNNFSEIGFYLAIALVTTFYGIVFANLVCKPIAIKLERRTEHRVMLMSMVMEGVSLISQRRSPSFIRATLNSFIAQHENELHAPDELTLDKKLSLASNKNKQSALYN